MRYNGEVGDIVVGRIIEVQQKLWKVDCGTRLNAFLNLAAVNLPGGELRRRGADDELVMRKFLQEGDLILGILEKNDECCARHCEENLSQGVKVRAALYLRSFRP